MKQSNQQENQAGINGAVLPDDDRQHFVESITAGMQDDAMNSLAFVLMELIMAIQEEPDGAPRVLNELRLLLESVFRHSKAYKLAHELYASKLELTHCEVAVSGDDLGEMLTKIKAAKLDSAETVSPSEPQTEPQKDEPKIYRLCEYERLDLDFYIKEDGGRAFNFELVRKHRETDEIYFNTDGTNETCFNRGGYSFPLRADNKGEVGEIITLSGLRGEILFLGYKDEKAFGFRYENSGDEFEGYFDVYDAKGDCVQSLIIYE
jgi:hypothetical protein